MTLHILSGLTATAVDAAIAQAVEDHTPGILLGSDKHEVVYTHTVNEDLAGLSVGPIIGEGRPVEVKFDCSAVWHSVASTITRADIKAAVNGGAAAIIATKWGASPATTLGPGMTVVAPDYLLADGSSYVFTVGLWRGAAGTTTWHADSVTKRPITLTVVSR